MCEINVQRTNPVWDNTCTDRGKSLDRVDKLKIESVAPWAAKLNRMHLFVSRILLVHPFT